MAEQGRLRRDMAAAAKGFEGENGNPSSGESLWPRLYSLSASGWRWGLLPPWQRRCERRGEGTKPPWKDEDEEPLDGRDRRLARSLTASVARARAHEGKPIWLGRFQRDPEKKNRRLFHLQIEQPLFEFFESKRKRDKSQQNVIHHQETF